MIIESRGLLVLAEYACSSSRLIMQAFEEACRREIGVSNTGEANAEWSRMESGLCCSARFAHAKGKRVRSQRKQVT